LRSSRRAATAARPPAAAFARARNYADSHDALAGLKLA